MLVDVRPIHKLRGDRAVDVGASLAPVLGALCEDSVDLSRLRVVCDWVQYKGNFRQPVDVRPILAPGTDLLAAHGTAPVAEEIEVAIDLRRSGDGGIKDAVHEALGNRQDASVPSPPARVELEDWMPTSRSCVWSFNALYWQALDLWEQATGRQYEQALPGGESDARNRGAVGELVADMLTGFDDLAARNALPEELYVVELGVGNGNQAKVWLDEFAAADRAHGTEYYRRLQYLMCDYSPHVLELARKAVTDHAAHVSSFVLDATAPTTALGFLRGKVFLVYISNVYDNLPTEEVARIGGRSYRVEARAYLARGDVVDLAEYVAASEAAVPALIHKLLRLGPALLAEALPERFPGVETAVGFWQRAWQALKLEERYVPLPGLDTYRIAPGVGGEVLRPLLESGHDVRMHVNNGAVASFVDTIGLLHPFGRLLCHDLFVTDTHQYRTGFRGPGKYDGSVVNWVNGPLLQLIGSRKGFDVCYAPFAHRSGTNIVTMTARVRD
ncbi:MAG: hypothetical protein GEV09_11630 [Pseudonocardiaceae bacterium]|nr:hypothetical protein [Pseudonocardiaceae bacterium]